MPERAKRLHRASVELLGSLDLERVEQATVDAACDILRADAAAVMLQDRSDPSVLVIRAHRGLSDRYVRSQRVPFEGARDTYRSVDEHVVIDLQKDGLGDRELARAEGLAKVLAIPLTKGGRFIGSLNAYAKDPRRTFRDEDIDLAHVLAAQAGIAIANAQLYREALRQREHERVLLDSLGTAVMVATPPGVVSGVNRAARDLVGIDEPAGWRLGELMRRADVRDAETGEAITRSPLMAGLAGDDWEGEIVFRNLRTGEERYAHQVVRPVRDESGAVVASVATLHDVTELRRIEREKEQFLSIVSHELRTPLTPLKALAQLLIARIRRARDGSRELDLDSLERNLASIERQVDRMNGLVSDLLSVSRAGRGQLEMDRRPFDLAAMVRDTVERYVEATREEGRHRFVVEAPSALTVTADQARVEQLLMNLIGNAVKYSPRGGEVRVCLSRHDGFANIVIADEGIGIAAADLARLGTPFTRGTGKAASFAGMGIGLHVAKLLADAHGGELRIASEGEDRGTTVTVRLPA